MADPGRDTQDTELKKESSLTGTAAQTPRYASEKLFASANEIRIDHNGGVYILRITRSGGLILNK
jgi:hemin uptake protein HemP